jgi:hypothetical protein
MRSGPGSVRCCRPRARGPGARPTELVGDDGYSYPTVRRLLA